MSLFDRSSNQVASLARQTGFSAQAVESMLRSVERGGGRMAQFDHLEFGGSGQWMQGGMLMISDPSNHDLKQRIDRLCEALSEWVAREPSSSPAGGFQSQSQTADGVTRVQDSRTAEGIRAVDLDPMPVVGAEASSPGSSQARTAGPGNAAAHDPFVALEKLADLHARGVLDDQEFATKKAELLQRI